MPWLEEMMTQEELTGASPLTQRSKDEESALDSEKRSQEISWNSGQGDVMETKERDEKNWVIFGAKCCWKVKEDKFWKMSTGISKEGDSSDFGPRIFHLKAEEKSGLKWMDLCSEGEELMSGRGHGIRGDFLFSKTRKTRACLNTNGNGPGWNRRSIWAPSAEQMGFPRRWEGLGLEFSAISTWPSHLKTCHQQAASYKKAVDSSLQS